MIDILDRYATVVSGEKRLLIGEPKLRYDNQENESDFFLVPFLTAQGIPRGRARLAGGVRADLAAVPADALQLSGGPAQGVPRAGAAGGLTACGWA